MKINMQGRKAKEKNKEQILEIRQHSEQCEDREVFEKFNIYKEMVENKIDSRIKCLRSNNGGEFKTKIVMDFCSKNGIKRQFSTARAPQQNGVVERKNMIVQEMDITMLMDSKLTNVF
jgi:transposase InsO family protein